MDFCRNVSIAGGLHKEYQQTDEALSPARSKLGPLDDLFSMHTTEGDVNLEWLSIFVEDCLTSTGDCITPAPVNYIQSIRSSNPPTELSKELQSNNASELQQKQSCPLQKFLIPGKARSKRKRAPSANYKAKNPLSSWQFHLNSHNQTPQSISSDPPLLQQAYWLADSELIVPEKEGIISNESRERHRYEKKAGNPKTEVVDPEAERSALGDYKESFGLSMESAGNGPQPRRCSHCLAQRTPQWRAGPLGPKTLCNACGVRYKSGRLLPEYRPAKSPTFVSYKHSNSHKKVLEMRMASASSLSSGCSQA